MVDFNKVRKSDLWYVIGYIATDGHLNIDGRHISITSKDRKHLYIIRKALFLKNKIGRKNNAKEQVKQYSLIQFGDVKFYRFLINLGFVQQKSLHLGALNIRPDYFLDFLRGIIDGDGNISHWIHKTNLHHQWSVRIYSGSLKFIEWLNLQIEKKFRLKGIIYSYQAEDRNNPIYILKFGKNKSKVILRDVYYKGCLALERKYLKAHLCLQDSKKMINYADGLV